MAELAVLDASVVIAFWEPMAPARGYAELLGRFPPEKAAGYLPEIADSVAQAVAVLDRLSAVVRFAESEFGGEVMLDLDAAAAGDEEQCAPNAPG